MWFFHFTSRDKRILCVGQQAQAMRTMSNGILTRLLQNNGKGSSALGFLGEMMCCWTSGCWFKLLVVGLGCCWASQSRAFTRIPPHRTECFVVDFWSLPYWSVSVHFPWPQRLTKRRGIPFAEGWIGLIKIRLVDAFFDGERWSKIIDILENRGYLMNLTIRFKKAQEKIVTTGPRIVVQ